MGLIDVCLSLVRRVQKLQREYATQEQLKTMAVITKKSIAQALAQQEKRISETEERRSELEEEQLAQSLKHIETRLAGASA